MPVHITRYFGTRIAAADALRESVRQLVVNPPYHDCQGPSCLLCGLELALQDYDDALPINLIRELDN